MVDLIVRNIDDAIVKALKASRHGVSAEAEHRKILEQVLLQPPKKTFTEVLKLMPDVGNDSDFERIQDDAADDVFT
ncbi:MAG: DNA-binding protein [Cyanobacteria bacterium P01_C01_bin.121]